MEEATEVVVIGGGPVGLFMAAELAYRYIIHMHTFVDIIMFPVSCKIIFMTECYKLVEVEYHRLHNYYFFFIVEESSLL